VGKKTAPREHDGMARVYVTSEAHLSAERRAWRPARTRRAARRAGVRRRRQGGDRCYVLISAPGYDARLGIDPRPRRVPDR